MNSNKRVDFLDIAKGFTMICVLLGHTWGIPDVLYRFCFSFHMPLFFIVSGYFFHSKDDHKTFLKKESKALLLPYIVTCLLIILISIILNILKNNTIIPDFIKWTLASLYGICVKTVSWPINIIPIGAIWFLLALFTARFILYEVIDKKGEWLWVILIAYTGYAMTQYIWLPLSIQAGMTATFFVYVGVLIRRYNLFEKGKFPRVFCYGMFAVWAFDVYYCGNLAMSINQYGDGLIDVIGAVCGTFCVIWISRFCEEHLTEVVLPFKQIGKMTLGILCLHLIEKNIFPWITVYKWLGIQVITGTWFVRFVLRILLVSIMILVVYFTPVLSKIFFPQVEKNKNKGIIL